VSTNPSQELAVREEPYAPIVFPIRKEDIEKKLLHVDLDDLAERFNSGNSFTFVRKKNEFNGEFGWKPKEIANFDPVASNMVLHDIWEHSPGSPATPIEEFQAIGSAMLTRFEGGYFTKIGKRPSDALPPAFGMLYFHAQVKADRPTTPCPFVTIAQRPLANTDTEMEMIRLIAQAREFVKSKEVFGPRLRQIDESMMWALPWMRVGYRKAELRFQGLDLRRLAQLYFETSAKLEELIRNDVDAEVRLTPRADRYSVKVEYVREFKFET
jgi:hypothetical protein